MPKKDKKTKSTRFHISLKYANKLLVAFACRWSRHVNAHVCVLMLISIRQRDNQNESSCTFCMHLPVKLCTDRPSLVENSSNISPRPLHPCPSWTNRRNHLPDSTVYVDEPSKKQEHLRRQPQPVRSHLIELVSATIDIDSGFQPTCSQRSKRLHRKWGDGLLRLRLSQTGDQLDFNGHTPYYSYTVCWHWADKWLDSQI